jgi:dihydroneopterin aldolase
MAMKSALAPPLSASGPAALWDAAQDYTRVILRDIAVEARIGLHPWERHAERPSRLVVNVEMFAPGKTPKNFINYDRIHGVFKSWPDRGHVDLLETLVEEVVGLCFAIPEVAACRVSIVKPDIFNDTAAVGIEVYRRRGETG